MPEFRKPPRQVVPVAQAPVSLNKPQNAVMPAPENTVGSPAYQRRIAAERAQGAMTDVNFAGAKRPIVPAPTSGGVTPLGNTSATLSGTPNIQAGTPADFFNTPTTPPPIGATFKKGGKVKKMASGGMTSKVSSASKRADGIATRGKTKCKMY